ncbi:Apoptosis-inducing factor 2 [Hondaea fermentalgiana]|uniref:Apoptosis-inducing factor 2 n=1 Tax=Hondaea fermentalgiana TaxID=2315210 RepID=A0A2R5GMF4_9STRA|nr:Apoptosis-inducing factor 2 [Hondaea fermentalgiana]|eukprot:GBG32060.1 Apoptosis-inducing factor 2 [Hondaea fermentalgiana]
MTLQASPGRRAEAQVKLGVLGFTRTAVNFAGGVAGRVLSWASFSAVSRSGKPVDLNSGNSSIEDEDTDGSDENESIFENFEMLGTAASTTSPGSRAGASVLGYSGYDGLMESEVWSESEPASRPSGADALAFAEAGGAPANANWQDGSFATPRHALSSSVSSHDTGSSRSDPVRIVIVGGGFAGIRAKLCLDRARLENCVVTLIDKKQFFEYTPGILGALTRGGWESLTRSYPRRGFVQGLVKRVDLDSVTVEAGGEFRVPFDYLIYAAGGAYGMQHSDPSGVIKPRNTRARHAQNPVQTVERWNDVVGTENEIADAEHIVIIGAGYVGVEWAAEIAEVYAGTEKCITLIDRNNEVCHSLPAAARQHIQSWLESRGVDLLLGARVLNLNKSDQTVALQVGDESRPRTLRFDLCLECKGLRPNTDALRPVFASALSGDGRICVNDELNVMSSDGVLKAHNIFAVGDVVAHKASARWRGMALYAELQADIACANIVASLQDKPARVFPSDVTHVDAAAGIPVAQVVSLGRLDASLRLEDFVVNGFAAAWLKVVMEETKLLEAAGNPAGHYFWQISERALMLVWRKFLVKSETKQSPKQASSSSTLMPFNS